MKVEETKLKGCLVLTPKVFKDSRGLFYESYNKQRFKESAGIDANFVQDNQSVSKKGTLRGLHFQIGEFAQAKLVRVVQGKILDVCVDLRQNSDTFGEHFSIILDSEEGKQLFIPKGFAHGFLTLSESAIFHYKCDAYYHKESERGIIYNDTVLNIDWNSPKKNLSLSEKDMLLPTLKDALREKFN